MAAWALLVCRLSCLISLCASSALYWHYLDPSASAFCTAVSGCEAVRQSPLAYFGSRYVSMPLFGLLAFAVFFGSTLQPQPAASRLFRWAAHAAGIAAVILLSIQLIWIGQLCWLCAVTDGAAVLGASAALLHVEWSSVPTRGRPPSIDLTRLGWVLLAVLVVVGPFGYYWLAPGPEVPAAVQERYQPGKINIIELADFQCPYCRRLHPVLRDLLSEYGDGVVLQRVHVPLDQHPEAWNAARAAICAAEQGQEERMADELFTRPLAPDLYPKLASEIGLDTKRFHSCLTAAETEQRLQADLAFAAGLDYPGLPTTYVGAERIVGAQGPDVYRSAIERAEQGASRSTALALFAASMVLGLALVLGLCRRRLPVN